MSMPSNVFLRRHSKLFRRKELSGDPVPSSLKRPPAEVDVLDVMRCSRRSRKNLVVRGSGPAAASARPPIAPVLTPQV